MAVRPVAKDPSPTGSILGEASLIRYTTNDMVSVVSFAVDPDSSGPNKTRKSP